MSVIQQYKTQISQRDKKIQEMQADIITTAEVLLYLLSMIGLDPLDPDFDKKEVSLFSLMPKASAALMSGKFSLEELGRLMPILDKYKHLLPEQPQPEPKKGFFNLRK